MIQDWIAESYAEMQAARLLTLQAAWKMDQLHAAGRHYSDARVEIAMIKFWGAKVLYNVIDRAIQVHGSLGYTTDLPLESMYRARPRRPHLRRARRGAQGHRRPPDPQAVQGGRGADRARADPPARRPREVRRLPRRDRHLELSRSSPALRFASGEMRAQRSNLIGVWGMPSSRYSSPATLNPRS